MAKKAKKESDDRELGLCPKSDRMIHLKVGRFGPYVQREVREGSKMKPRNVALLKDMDPKTITLETALKLLSLPRNVGNHPISGDEIEVNNGRYGPYIKSGKETRTLPPDMSPIEITFEQCVLLLSQPKKKAGKKKTEKTLKILGQSPVTEQSVTILLGKFGLYVTDAVTKATLPKEIPAEEFTLDMALELLATKKASEQY